jgi:hypothetical protein
MLLVMPETLSCACVHVRLLIDYLCFCFAVVERDNIVAILARKHDVLESVSDNLELQGKRACGGTTSTSQVVRRSIHTVSIPHPHSEGRQMSVGVLPERCCLSLSLSLSLSL